MDNTMLPTEARIEDLVDQQGRLISYSRPCPGVTVAAFLRQAQGLERFYWESRRDQVALGGFGIAAELSAWGKGRFQAINQQAQQLFADSMVFSQDQTQIKPRLFGGFAFTDDFVPDNTWSIYPPAYFALPHYQISQFGEEMWLTINATMQSDDNPQDIMARLREALDARYEVLLTLQDEALSPTLTHGKPVEINYPMPYETWERTITKATRLADAGELEKVVLSRVCELRFANRVDVDTALHYLSEKYADCYRFLFEPRPHHAFYGATPELLAKVDGQTVTTMALAGSVRRGSTPDEDAALAGQLLHDPKERLEHALVVNAIQEKLGEFVDSLTVPDQPEIYPLSNIQHLHTPILGHLKQSCGILPIVEMLHPTPAMGGAPRDSAMDFIRMSEPVPRGWYAAPIGWIDSQLDGMFGVAIRSAVSEDRRVWLYAGAGILASSIPQKEWDETALKFKPMLNALGVGEEFDVGT